MRPIKMKVVTLAVVAIPRKIWSARERRTTGVRTSLVEVTGVPSDKIFSLIVATEQFYDRCLKYS